MRWIAAAVMVAGVIAVVAHGSSAPSDAHVALTAPSAPAGATSASASTTMGVRPAPSTAPAAPAAITATLSPPSSLPPPNPAEPAPPVPISFTTDTLAPAPDAADTTAPLPEVALYGDSLTVSAWGHYQDITAGKVQTRGHAYYGMALPDWADDILHDPIDRLVLALGTNDADKEGARPWADLLNKLPATKCIVWPKPYEGSNNVKLFNTQMLAIVAAHPNVHVIDWDSTVKAHPEWVGPDHRHYGAAGSDAYAEMLRQAALTCP